jgi:CRISPR-associated endonuclease/helicase Cas3
LRDLALHLIASHHGYARPFAPVVDDPEPPNLTIEKLSDHQPITVSPAERLEKPAHRLDSGVPDRFWRLLRQHGPWGLAFLESILRLADQQASEAEANGAYAKDSSKLETTSKS